MVVLAYRGRRGRRGYVRAYVRGIKVGWAKAMRFGGRRRRFRRWGRRY